MKVSLSALETLSAVIDEGSFAGAARRLGYTPSAVSQQIAALERSLSLELFERRGRSVHPTEAARHLHARSAELLGLLTKVESDVERLAAGQAGRIRIGSFPSADSPILSRALARFVVKRREVEVQLEEGEPFELLPQVTRGDIDVALAFRYETASPPWPEDLTITPLLREPLYVVASQSHRLARRRRIDLGELSTEVWAANRPNTLAHACLLSTAAGAGFRPNIAYCSNNFDAIRAFARNGLAIGLLPGLAATEMPGITRLAVEGLPHREVAAVTRSGGEPDALQSAMLASLQQAAREVARERRWRDSPRRAAP